jgi:DNA-binding transcriptional LysR family regulator
MDKLAAMRAFVEIVDRGSLTAAAKALDRSLPSMVRTLADLERSLSAVLLRRTTRRMSLTEEGRVYLERCRRILADVAQAEALLGSSPRELRGPLRVTAPVLFGQMHVAPAVVDFVRRHPAVEVELLLLDRIVDLVDEGIDAAVRIARLPDSSMIAVPVGQVRRVVCASPQLLRAVGEPRRPEELATRPCVRFRGLTPGSAWTFHDAGRELAVSVGGGFATNHAAAALEACAAGLGFGLFLSYQVEPALRVKQLRVVLRDFEPPPFPVSLVYSDARLLSLRLRVFLDWMKERLRALGRQAGSSA